MVDVQSEEKQMQGFSWLIDRLLRDGVNMFFYWLVVQKNILEH